MARSKSSISTFLAPFRRQAYQSWYLDGYNLVEFTKLMDILFEELAKITFVRMSASERQWRTCKTVWDNAWNIKGGGTAQEACLGLEALHVWFRKGPRGGIMWMPLGLENLILDTLLPGLAIAASGTLRLAGQPLSLSGTLDDTGYDEDCVREEKPKPSYSNSATSETDQGYPEANASDTHVPNPNDTILVPYSQPGETNVTNEEHLGNYTSYSQLNDGSCILTGQATSETASSIWHVAPYYTMPCYQGTVCTQDGPARRCAESPDSATQVSHCIPASKYSAFTLCHNAPSQIDWLANLDV